MQRPLDDIDWVLLRGLSAHGRQTMRALAKLVGLSEPSASDRVQRLERDNVITGYHAAINPAVVDASTAAFVAIRFEPGEQAKAEVNEALLAVPSVLELHEVAGEDCYWAKLRVASPSALAETLDHIRAIPPVHATNTTIVLRTVFERPLLAGESKPPE